MKPQALSILTVGLLAATLSAQAQPAKPPPTSVPPPPPAMTNTNKTDFSKIFKNDKEKISYAIGMSWGAGLKTKMKQQGVDIDLDAFTKGFRDNLGDGPSVITEAQEHEIITEYGNKMRAEREAKMKEAGSKNKTEGEAFLAKNKTAPGVVTLPDGLQYKILTEGKGEPPKPEDEVTVNYRGTLINGTEFDSSFKRHQPFTTHVRGGIIKGWSEALQLMKPGAKWQLFIPPDLAYGERGAGAQIGPDSTLIFEVELLSVKPGTPPHAAAPPSTPPLTSDIIKVPSADELKKGAKIETIKPEDLDKEKAKASKP